MMFTNPAIGAAPRATKRNVQDSLDETLSALYRYGTKMNMRNFTYKPLDMYMFGPIQQPYTVFRTKEPNGSLQIKDIKD